MRISDHLSVRLADSLGDRTQAAHLLPTIKYCYAYHWKSGAAAGRVQKAEYVPLTSPRREMDLALSDRIA
jgi:hypothetical protein